MEKEQLNKIVSFLAETQMLKRVKHIGVILAGVKEPDSLGEHAALASQIAYVLAKLENANVEKCVLMCLFHSNAEIRIGNHSKVANRYLDTKEASLKSRQEHFANLPESLAQELLDLQEEKKGKITKEGIVAQDADYLEMAIQAKIYTETGYKGCEDWISNIESALKTETAKQILAEIKNNSDFLNCWWQGLKKLPTK